jgi:uncharacterized protein (DUF2147 family)
MRIKAIAVQTTAAAVTLLAAGVAHAENSPLGVWIDQTGRGAVEIRECDGNLCGYVAWVKDTKDQEGCGEQIIGNVEPVGAGTWDNGWIYDPDRGKKFDVEIKPISADELRVTGYAGLKWLSETMTWKRAPADLQKCSKSGSAAAPPAKDKATTADAKDDGKPGSSSSKEAMAAPDQKEPKVLNGNGTSKSDAIAKDDPAPSARDDDDDTKSANADEDDDGADRPRRHGGKAMAKIAEALNFRKIDRDTCRMDVPYVDMVVTFHCNKDD